MFEICHNYCNYSSHIYLFIWCLHFCWKYKKNIYEMKMKTKTRAKIHLYRYNMAIDRLSVCQCVMWVLFLALSLVEFSLLLLFFLFYELFNSEQTHTHNFWFAYHFCALSIVFSLSLSLINRQQNMFYYLFSCHTCCHNFYKFMSYICAVYLFLFANVCSINKRIFLSGRDFISVASGNKVTRKLFKFFF